MENPKKSTKRLILRNLFDAYVHFQKALPPTDTLEEVYYQDLEPPQGKEIHHLFEELRNRHEKLFGLLVEITDSRDREYKVRAVNRGRIAQGLGLQPGSWAAEPTQEEKELRDFYYSQAFDAIAPTALSLDPHYDLTKLCH